MELLQDHHVGVKMLAHLHQVLAQDYPALNPAELGLQCDLQNVSWWKGDASDPLQDFVDLYRYIAEESAPEIGYALAGKAHLTDLGMMGYAMMTAATLEDFILVASYSLEQFSFPFQVFLKRLDDGLALVEFSETPNNRNCFDRYLEFTMALAWHYIGVISPLETALKPKKVCFKFSENPQNSKVVSAFYQSEIEYNALLNGIIVPSQALSSRLAVGTLADIVSCSLQCNQILGNSRFRGKYHRMVERALIEAPHICKFSLPDTAAYLNINERNLRAYLAADNASFREISLHVRMQLAKEYLVSTRFPVKQIAYMLSYTEPNNFIRAFKRYAGVSPLMFRTG